MIKSTVVVGIVVVKEDIVVEQQKGIWRPWGEVKLRILVSGRRSAARCEVPGARCDGKAGHGRVDQSG